MKNNIRLVLVFVFVLIAIGTITHSLFIWYGVSMFALALVLFGLHQYRAGNYLAVVLITAVLFRITIIIINSQLYVFKQPPISNNHSKNAAMLVNLWSQGQFFQIPTFRTRMYAFIAYVLAPFYVLFGSWQVAGELATALFGTLIGYIAYKLAMEITTYRNAVFAAGIVAFWPSIVYRSVVIQREVIITVAMLTMLWIALRWTERVCIRDFAILLLIATVIFITRKENFAIIAVTLAVALLFRFRQAPKYLAVVALVSVPFLAYFALNFGVFTGYGTSITPQAIDAYAHNRAFGDLAYLVNLHYNSWFDILLYLPLKVVYYLFSPMPWQVNSIADLLAGISGWAMAVAVLLAIPGFFWVQGDIEKRLTMVAYAVSGIVPYAIIEMNAGAAFRRRIQFIPIILIFAAVAISVLWNQVATERSVDTGGPTTDSASTITSDSE